MAVLVEVGSATTGATCGVTTWVVVCCCVGGTVGLTIAVGVDGIKGLMLAVLDAIVFWV